eukprot:CAMPEP_0175108234 /NCGR_PEP_ID=MMETSP0086_2-20121207/12500_1 /TAXON_ID=136419 /ORGANISM="Unknown Unknown, Strain D1" /LENGTH=87 /DNA_ID=CAMNT_0016385375 /DNA_START=379 /DNA_END=639 /DNA_ORIENTATION=+
MKEGVEGFVTCTLHLVVLVTVVLQDLVQDTIDFGNIFFWDLQADRCPVHDVTKWKFQRMTGTAPAARVSSVRRVANPTPRGQTPKCV